MNETKELVPLPAEEVGRRYPTMDLVQPPFSPGPQLRDYWEVLVKRRWTVFTFVLIASSLAAVASFKMKPIYRASARIEIESERPQITTLNNLDQQQRSDVDFLETQAKILDSEHLAWVTIQALSLDRNPEFADEVPADRPADGRKALLIRRFKNHLNVGLIRSSRLVEVSFEDGDPARAAAVVNSLARNYVEYNFRKQYEATTQASEWMTQELDTLKAKVEKSQQAMVSYETANAAINIDDKQNVTLQKLADLTRQLTDAQGDRIQKESLYRLATGKEHLPAAVQSEFLGRLRERLAELNDQYAATKSQFGSSWPTVIALKSRLEQTRQQIEQEEQRLLGKLRSEYLTAVDRQAGVSRAVNQQKKEATRLNQLGIQYSILKREAESNQNLYNILLQRMKEAGVSAGLRASNIHIVDRALPPIEPVRPRPTLNIAISLIVGLVLGITVAFVQEYMDTTVKTPDHVEQVTGLISLGIIPVLEGAAADMRLPQRRRLLARNGHADRKSLLLTKSPQSPFAEACRKLRTSFLLSQMPAPPAVSVVTSALPGEGKTSIAVNLAIALAQQGASVLLIDADLRRPRVHGLLGLDNTYGLTTLLTNHTHLEPLRVPALPNLAVLPAGPATANPAELLSSPRMEALLRQYRSSYTHVLVDSPPLFHFTDAVVLSHFADGVLLVAEAGSTTREMLKRTFRTLADARSNVLGVVLNKVDFRSEPYYYSPYAYRYYQHYYGQAAADPRKS